MIRELLALTKPHLTLHAVIAGAGGLLLAPGAAGLGGARIAATLAGIALFVGAANALNQYLERDGDAQMTRTAGRPLPAGRLAPRSALLFGLGGTVLASVGTALLVRPVVALLGLGALLTYVLVYTPLKRVTPRAMLVGAISGAAPPLLGWAAVTGTVGAVGLALFGIVFFWQLPHFLAIAIYRREEYARAGVRTVAVARGERVARRQMLSYSLLLIAASLLLIPLGAGGVLYGATALGLGAHFLWRCARGLDHGAARWARPARTGARTIVLRDRGRGRARSLFRESLLYLPALSAVLLLEAVLR